MLINVDAKALEWVVCAHLSKDPIAILEIENNIDQHTENQKMLALPEGKEGRLIAKIFVFRLIYGSIARGFCSDQDFIGISTKESFWQDKINKFYNKYKGIERFHQELVKEHKKFGRIVIPTGRSYVIPEEFGFEMARPKILNYPVQGLGHDLMTIARVSLYKRMHEKGIKALLISTIHDSIIIDCEEKDKDVIISIIRDVWKDIPKNYEILTDDKFMLPMRCEISYGNNLKEMTNVN